VLVLENVPAALSGRHRRHWIALEDRLRLAGYSVRRMMLLGEESGVAQRRKRLFLICWTGSDCVRLELERVRAPSLRSTLAGAEAAGNHRPNVPGPGSRDAAIAAAIGQGQKLSNVRLSPKAIPTWSIPQVFGAVTDAQRELLEAVVRLRRRDRRRSFGDGDPVALARLNQHLGRDAAGDVAALVERDYLRDEGGEVELRHTYNGKYRRLTWAEASPTVDTHFGRPSLFLHPEEDRGLSVREAARIQGFPDAYVFEGSRAEQFEAVGNAVPPPMASRIAEFVREALLKP
jgi:DNA (cytosine-5)-methyltransferase 1